jgi:MoaA/NifB/PqqE/SkfB family radical SAM enzyme
MSLFPLKPVLKSVAIEISSACNRSCVFCPNHSSKRGHELLDEQLFCKIIDDLVLLRFSGRVALHLFNEPLLDKRITKLIAFVKQRLPSAHIFINTNGDCLDLAMWKRLREAGLSSAGITQYDGRINDNIRKILDRLDRDEKARFAVRIFHPHDANNRAGAIRLEDRRRLPLRAFCPRPFYQLCITFRGVAVVCCNDYHSEVKLGDLRAESVGKIWESPLIEHYRYELKRKNRAGLQLCAKCDMVTRNAAIRKLLGFFPSLSRSAHNSAAFLRRLLRKSGSSGI